MIDHKIFNERPECQDRLIKLLVRMGYQYVSRSEAEEKRGKLTRVLFDDEMIRFLKKQTYETGGHEFQFSGDNIATAVRKIDVPIIGGLMPASKEIYDLLIFGTSVTEKVPMPGGNSTSRDFDLKYIDYENIDNNIFQVTEEFSVEKLNGEYRRPDIVLLINGIPIVVIECKKSAVNVSVGISQNCKNMMPDGIPELFKFSQIVVSLNPNKVKYGTCGTNEKWFSEWKEHTSNAKQHNEIINKYDATKGIAQDEVAVSLFDKKRLLNLVQNYILYDSGEKKIARYQQFFATENSIKRLKGEDKTGTTDGGVIWHTQGSGKSLTMVMLVKRIMTEFSELYPRFLMVTDRIDLDKQLTENFVHTGLEPKRANTGRQLVNLLNGNNSVITTIINKFETAVKNKYVQKSSSNVFVLVDEAHRSNYGLRFNEMKEVLPNAKMIAFTGTPLIANENKQTEKQFGKIIHSYTMRDGISDGIIVPLVYGSRIVKQGIANESALDEYFKELTDGLTAEEKEEYKKEYSRHSRLSALDARIMAIARDIQRDFRCTCMPKGLKAMVACSSRACAIKMYEYLKKYNGINPIVSISFAEPENKNGEKDDTSIAAQKLIKEYHEHVVKPKFGNNDEKYYEHVLNNFTSESDASYNILIVKDKHLTGFDAPIVGTLYLDKSIQDHNILQAIARVNRIYKTKDVGIIVDYCGVLKKLNEAITMYDKADANLNLEKENFSTALFSISEEINNLKKLFDDLESFFSSIISAINKNKFTDNEIKDMYQETLRENAAREIFNTKLRLFEKHLYLAQSNRQIFVAIGPEQMQKYKDSWVFYKKLQASSKQRFEVDEIDENGKQIISEDVMIDLLNQFVIANEVKEIKEIIEPFSIDNDERMRNALEQIGISKRAKADLIKTKIKSKLKQIRYDDPLLYEEFSAKINKTIIEHENSRNEDAFLADIARIADDFKNGLKTQDYPIAIKNDSDGKAIYGSIINEIKKTEFDISLEQENIVANLSLEIKKMLLNKTKKDWKHNIIVHKDIQRELDDLLFGLFDEFNIKIDKTNVKELIDQPIEEIMRIAIIRF